MPEAQLLVYGAGGHGRVVADAAEQSGWIVSGFIDDRVSSGTVVGYRYRVLGNREWLGSQARTYRICLGIGDNYIRRAVALFVASLGFSIESIVSPHAVISPSARIGVGSVIFAGAVVNSMASLGTGTIINSGAIVEHDAIVGEFAHLSPRSALGGGAAVGDLTHVGMGCSILPLIPIGSRSIVGAGSVVTRRVPDDVVAFGVPARVRRSVAAKQII